MKVDIWSDIRCPFCYIGKRHFEKALETFPQKDSIEIIWHSFELDPSLITKPDENSFDHFAKTKNVDPAQAKAMFQNVSEMAKNAGLTFDLEHQKVANSLKGHLLIQYAQSKGLGNEMKEALLKAQLVDGKNIDDVKTLISIAAQFSISEDEVKNAMNSQDLKSAVANDQLSARKLGITGVPFFVFNNKYGVSGAQPVEVLADTLQKSFEEFSEETQNLKIIASGESCDTDGNCD